MLWTKIYRFETGTLSLCIYDQIKETCPAISWHFKQTIWGFQQY